MTIDLGFAWVTLPSGREVSIVDVPGHERFIKNMLAGVGGIDLALLIVAADESVMPQTREHLAILDLLGVRRGLAVITKSDLADADILALVQLEVEELLATTTLADSPVHAVSATTGEGVQELAAAIDAALDETEQRRDVGRPRLPVDRSFAVAGFGTVVTGTLIDGTLEAGQPVEIVPGGVQGRIRGLQSHRQKIDAASPGNRVAVNLSGVSAQEINRGWGADATGLVAGDARGRRAPPPAERRPAWHPSQLPRDVPRIRRRGPGQGAAAGGRRTRARRGGVGAGVAGGTGCRRARRPLRAAVSGRDARRRGRSWTWT